MKGVNRSQKQETWQINFFYNFKRLITIDLPELMHYIPGGNGHPSSFYEKNMNQLMRKRLPRFFFRKTNTDHSRSAYIVKGSSITQTFYVFG